MSDTPRVILLMADYGHDPTETAVPYTEFVKAGFKVTFATENGKVPACDKRMLTGLSQKLLGATKSAISLYTQMTASLSFQSPLSWSSPDFSLLTYDLVFLPGGHDKGVRQIIDSLAIKRLLVAYFPLTNKESSEKKVLAAVCHGVMVLSEALVLEGEDKDKSVMSGCTTTALPAVFEGVAYQGTRLWLGDYYLTYGRGSDSVETAVKKRLDDPGKQWKCSLSPSPFVVEDEKYNYVSARFPPDAKLLAEKAVELVRECQAR
ncbi:class I glutamine amidotransferase-like protein [Stereum hirsutum FP-91666 SS1]|uniref:class I glutamine amidotransferase-like protein n=1 Tax=Stereum hirsutum (strain FP-91666) TaxID=721885 RepID=UPI0004449A05|nr:class I glutamine amidotransferase-like protein [Stereum hirsutum FP-91666 SS1]EIM84983.1 class I glutamine amidotransferase-like protein [Stereum hirsutum FP-91666 SS1]